MNIAYVVTEDWLDKVKPSIASLKRFNPEARVFIVTDAEKIDIDAEHICVKDQEYFTERNCINYRTPFSVMALIKVAYPDLLPVDKVIHLDADTIVNDSLEDLWNMDLEGKWFAMVREWQGHFRPMGDRYYNAGVFVANLKQIREDGIMKEMIRFIREVPVPYGEQDAMNGYGLHHDKIIDADVRYNESFCCGYTDNPAIIHYAGVVDWWDNTTMPRAEFLDYYRKVVS